MHNAHAAAPAQPAGAPIDAGECVTFRVAQEEYGLDILKVQELRESDKVTRIANAPSDLKGVINLRSHCSHRQPSRSAGRRNDWPTHPDPGRYRASAGRPDNRCP